MGPRRYSVVNISAIEALRQLQAVECEFCELRFEQLRDLVFILPTNDFASWAQLVAREICAGERDLVARLMYDVRRAQAVGNAWLLRLATVPWHGRTLH